ncbi:WYL domain-containing protein [Pannonibacter phragmitetus]|uniref:WYL domain-containing protein n=1 Tax=Pannonibacter phragmitetus TaxID=121719 RepID=UPI002452CBBB|nr:WYL domain-containing protein [Pannonibacter phragmitetus]
MLILPPLWYLVGWDPGREDFRHFRMDRISHPQPVAGKSFRQRHVPFEDDVCPYRLYQCSMSLTHRALVKPVRRLSIFKA